ncbi:hypothetical protein N0Y54_33330 [Nostoc punctiforme UO1]|uniref:Uncharacterized protein n=1 Tax=Desmonostoc muscorum LEGE 12446 TaxID=1828758 RepID=A0A8J6ZUF7_DESMC|nr:hypothetical protein [Desmonostoc muscorum]MCF2151878.1 hypothetical protein [Desmonostoc muscorum LEGE 12446]
MTLISNFCADSVYLQAISLNNLLYEREQRVEDRRYANDLADGALIVAAS